MSVTDVAESIESNMQHATAHDASAMPDPPHFTPAPLPPESLRSARQSGDSNAAHSSKPTNLNLSIGDTSGGVGNSSADRGETPPPTSAISSYGGSQATETFSQQEERLIGEATRIEGAQQQKIKSTSQSPPPNNSSGIKRTASGEVKRSSVNVVADGIPTSNGVGHSYTLSTASDRTKGNVLELSQQLRTKLKYAMVKVQNGWQTRSLDEVESLASQSPRSTVSGFHHLQEQHLLSPRTAMSRKYQRQSSESESSDSTVALESRGLVSMVGSPSATSRRALAPPADIVPGSRRRPTPNAAVQSVNGVHVQSRNVHSSRPHTNQRTPSQNAAMEADAVETLLFMASPNNSGYNPPSHASQDSSLRSAQVFSSQTSPLRTQFSQTSVTSPKKVVFSDAGSPHPSFDKAALIDRMLDELSDDSDDELEQAFQLAEKSKIPAPVTT
ncbi:uncharacterized protein A1O5_06562 [Cladophialophora psammophila CBS 110553]|uniref:Uncharacterized protein n=1 Tax=Cladophialophora psammophila CBS 110553 TaxID=1182543 RepID=W9WRE9_9EURO|nr:uncharacterized protein A1O5_06562 [Cladophialophora psammophila CBS 110553]EXJ70493.1 hypothetical protein A1O5_06562 [Cladophialophora psammophila CBS 110553]